MAAVARKSRTDRVFSPHGAGYKCRMPSTQYTDSGSSRVFIEGVGVVRKSDAMSTHTMPGCLPHTPTLDNGSSRVFAEGRGVARIGDVYGSEHPIISGSHRVFSA